MTKESGADKVQAAALGHNKQNLKKRIDTIIDKERKIATLKAEIANEYKRADDEGFDTKALKFMVKHETKPTPVEFKREVNNMCEALGKQLVFDLPVIVDKKEVKKEGDKGKAA